MTNLIAELRRRNVFRVATAYIIVAWLLAQVAELALDSFGAPTWVIKTILLLLILGLPVAIVFAWAFELTPEGIKREKDVDRSESITGQTGQRLNYVIIGLLAVALAYFVYESRFAPDPASSAGETISGSVAARSIAVLPFATFGGTEADSHLADGLAETLLNLLAQIDELQVAARTSAFKFKGTSEDIRVIGEQLGVATVLEGSVQRSGDRVRITAQLVDVANGFHVYSETFERQIDDIFAIQDEIARAVVDALEVELLGTATEHSVDVDAYATHAGLRSRLRTSSGDEMEAVIESLRSLTREFPDYADAWATLADAYRLHGYAAGLIPEDMMALSIEAGQEAVELAPDDAIGHIALGSALMMRGRLTEASPVIARALELQPGNADLMVLQGNLLATYEGRYSEALDITSQALLRDPLNGNTRAALATRLREMGRIVDGEAALNLGIELDATDLRLQWDRVIFFEESGLFDKAAVVLDQVLDRDPSNINAIQNQFYLLFNAGDFENALLVLERGEDLSQDRLADERALYCYTLGDTECWHAATTRMLATRNRFFVQIWQARMLYESGLVDEAIVALLPIVDYFDQTGDPYGNQETRANLGALYHMAGEAELRDEALAPIITAFDTSVNNGYEGWHLYLELAAVKAARGEFTAAMNILEECYRRGFRHLDSLYYRFAFDPMRDDPDYQAFLERIRTENAAQLAEKANTVTRTDQN